MKTNKRRDNSPLACIACRDGTCSAPSRYQIMAVFRAAVRGLPVPREMVRSDGMPASCCRPLRLPQPEAAATKADIETLLP